MIRLLIDIQASFHHLKSTVKSKDLITVVPTKQFFYYYDIKEKNNHGSYQRTFKVAPSIVMCFIVNILSMSGEISLSTPMHEKMQIVDYCYLFYVIGNILYYILFIYLPIYCIKTEQKSLSFLIQLITNQSSNMQKSMICNEKLLSYLKDPCRQSFQCSESKNRSYRKKHLKI